MEVVTMRFKHIDLRKISVCFTWDDNCAAHYRLIAPLFLRLGLRCTFYINPGKKRFKEKFLAGYRSLSDNGCEIGSHGFFHDNVLNMTAEQAEGDVKASADSIYELFGIYPSTFAFPYHDFNEDTLALVRRFHLETRNTLNNSARFGIRTSSTVQEMRDTIDECAAKKRNLVFSGHSAVLSAKDASLPESGYEPIPAQNLEAVLEHVKSMDNFETLTFEQAALKEFLRDNCETNGDSYTLKREQMDYLGALHIGAQRLDELV